MSLDNARTEAHPLFEPNAHYPYNQIHLLETSDKARNKRTKKQYRDTIKELWGNCCAYCGSTEELTIDHIIPKYKGGSDDPNNLAAACPPCNLSKGSRDVLDWYLDQDFFDSEKLIRVRMWAAGVKEFL